MQSQITNIHLFTKSTMTDNKWAPYYQYSISFCKDCAAYILISLKESVSFPTNITPTCNTYADIHSQNRSHIVGQAKVTFSDNKYNNTYKWKLTNITRLDLIKKIKQTGV